MSEQRREYRGSSGLVVLMVLGFAISTFFAVLMFRTNGLSWDSATLFALAVLFIAGIAETLTTKIVLESDRLEFVSNFRLTVVPRADIVRAVAEIGVPITIELKSGSWLKLPETVAGPHPNAIHAWLKRVPAETT